MPNLIISHMTKSMLPKIVSVLISLLYFSLIYLFLLTKIKYVTKIRIWTP